MNDMHTVQNQVATVIILPTLWSGPWIWRHQIRMFNAFSRRRLLVEDAIANWGAAPRLDALDAYVLDRIGAAESPWLLVGASLGGLLALRLAAHQPERVAGVIASGCPGLGPAGELGVRLTSSNAPQEMRRLRAQIFVDSACLGDEELAAAMAEVAGHDAVRRAVRILRILNSYDPTGMLHSLRRPTALIWGQCDLLTPGRPWRTVAAENSHLLFGEVPETGHVPMLEAPARFRTTLRTVWDGDAAKG